LSKITAGETPHRQ